MGHTQTGAYQMKSAALLTALGLVVSSFLAAAAMNACSQEASKEAATAKTRNLDWLTKHPVILRLLDLHNAERRRVGLTELKLNPKMCLAAQKHATWMAQTGWYAHSGLPYRENIHTGVTTPEDATNGWIFSPAHYQNIISSSGSSSQTAGPQVGFGYMTSSPDGGADGKTYGQPYWVALFW